MFLCIYHMSESYCQRALDCPPNKLDAGASAHAAYRHTSLSASESLSSLPLVPLNLNPLDKKI